MSYRVSVLCLLAILVLAVVALAEGPPTPEAVLNQPSQASAVEPAPADPGIAAILGIQEPVLKTCASRCWDTYFLCVGACPSNDTNCHRSCANDRDCCLAACNPGQLCGLG